MYVYYIFIMMSPAEYHFIFLYSNIVWHSLL